MAAEVTKIINKSATIVKDVRLFYKSLEDICTAHKIIIVADIKEVAKVILWVHTGINNTKKLLGLHHNENDKYKIS